MTVGHLIALYLFAAIIGGVCGLLPAIESNRPIRNLILFIFVCELFVTALIAINMFADTTLMINE